MPKVLSPMHAVASRLPDSFTQVIAHRRALDAHSRLCPLRLSHRPGSSCSPDLASKQAVFHSSIRVQSKPTPDYGRLSWNEATGQCRSKRSHLGYRLSHAWNKIPVNQSHGNSGKLSLDQRLKEANCIIGLHLDCKMT